MEYNVNVNLRQALKARAHHLKPTIILGSKGLTESVLQETDIALRTHELIKIKLHGLEKSDRELVIDEICTTLHATFVQLIGKTLILFRKNTNKAS
jgi:RNA-binding protein